MNTFKKLMIVGVLGSLMVSCADESPWNEDNSFSKKGKISLSLDLSSELETTIPQVRAVTSTVTPPPSSEFKIILSKVDGSYSKTWSSVEEFAKEDQFSIGVYELEAYYGEPSNQGVVKPYEKSYLHSYYYGKVENITVLEGKETKVQLYSALANSVVQVEYTDAYKKYFTDWNTTLKTSGPEDVVLGKEEALCYVTPGDIDVVMDATLQNGKKLFLNPAVFKAEPKHLYKVKYNIYNGEIGDAILQINFNDDPTGLTDINIPLTDELKNNKAPEITLDGFESGDEIETQVGVPFENQVIGFGVIAHGGLQEAILSVSSSNSDYTPSFLTNGKVNLCTTDANKQTEISKAGIVARGFYNSTSEDVNNEMAYLDLTEYCKKLPAGKYSISLMVKDKFDQTDEGNAKFSLNTVNTNVQVLSSFAKFEENYADLVISYDGPDPTKSGNNPFSFKMRNPHNGIDEIVDIVSITTGDATTTRATYEMKTYTYRIKRIESPADEYPVSLYFNESSKPVCDSHMVKVVYPNYEVEYDAFAKWMRLRVADLENDAAKRKLFTERLRVFVDDVEQTELHKDNLSGVISFEGLNSAQTYQLKTSLQIKNEPEIYSSVTSVKTETEEDVPNGDFTEVEENSINVGSIDVGGKYNVTFMKIPGEYQNTSSIKRSEPSNWANLNSLTCWKESKTKNTWYMVPSTFVDNNEVVIRTVGYSHQGKVPSTSGGDNNTNYYCENSPSYDQFLIRSGELFLGNYNYNGQENRNDGIQFNHRPSRISFIYSYNGYNNEDGKVDIVFYDKNNNIICSKTEDLITQKNWSCNLDLEFNDFGVKPSKLEIKFMSTGNTENPTIRIPDKSELALDRVTVFISKDGRTLDANSYHAFAMGSELRISNVHFEY